MINSKVYEVIISLHWMLKTDFKVLILMLGQLIECYIEKIFM